ncbi:MAG: acyl carrier protein [Oscillospiraceae bacterium]|nr:acyl carrier protein [Oscillospiraceae bacterium]
MLEKLKKLIAEQFAVDEDSITLETSFVDDLGADSLDLVELSMSLEEEFGVSETDDETLARLRTVGDVFNFICNNDN